MFSLPIAISEAIKNCTRCALQPMHNGPVPPRWRADLAKPEVFIIGEAPGEKEDLKRTPFIGASGTVLGKWLTAAGVESAYVTNTVKCRPPNNKLAKVEFAISACAPHLDAELVAVAPRLIVCVGRYAGNIVLRRSGATMEFLASLNAQAARVITGVGEVPVVSIYHPASYMYGGSKSALSKEENIEQVRIGLRRAGLPCKEAA